MGFLYKRDIAQFVTVVDNHDVWLTALILLSTHGPVLLVNVYMPTDYETWECSKDYMDVCAKINIICNDSEAAYLVTLTVNLMYRCSFMACCHSWPPIVPNMTTQSLMVLCRTAHNQHKHRHNHHCHNVIDFYQTELKCHVTNVTASQKHYKFLSFISTICVWDRGLQHSVLLGEEYFTTCQQCNASSADINRRLHWPLLSLFLLEWHRIRFNIRGSSERAPCQQRHPSWLTVTPDTRPKASQISWGSCELQQIDVCRPGQTISTCHRT